MHNEILKMCHKFPVNFTIFKIVKKVNIVKLTLTMFTFLFFLGLIDTLVTY